LLVCAAAQHVRCQKALGTLQQLKFHGFALVESPVAIFLDSGKVDKDVFSRRALNEAIAFGSVEPFDCSLLFHKCNSFRLSFRIENLPQKLPGGEKGCYYCRPDSSFPEQMAAVPEGLTAGDSSNRIVRRSSTAVQKHQPECALRDDRRELGIIFRNSGFCKALCFTSRQNAKVNAFYATFVSEQAPFIKASRVAFSVTIFTGSQ
jgi:hypothetical protein